MKAVSIILSVVSILMMGSTLLCGFWLRSHTAAGTATDPTGVTFHIQIAVATVVCVLVTLGVFLFSN